MAAVLAFFHWWNTAITYGWPIILAADWFLRSVEPHKRRMRRGKWFCWQVRTFGPFGVFLWEFPLLGIMIAGCIAFRSAWPANIWWTYIAVGCAVDWITGSDDPPFKRWVEAAKKKLTIAPPPRPAIDLS